jgi:hypothetical protein
MPELNNASWVQAMKSVKEKEVANKLKQKRKLLWAKCYLAFKVIGLILFTGLFIWYCNKIQDINAMKAVVCLFWLKVVTML